jgi:DNA-binding NarL/FixJ family response regulator
VRLEAGNDRAGIEGADRPDPGPTASPEEGIGAPGGEHRAPIRVIVAEDSYLIREVLTATLSAAPEVELVAVCANGKELRTAVPIWNPEVVVTDIRMPPSGAEEGIRVAASLRDSNPEMGVVVLSQYAEPAYALALLDRGSGRRGYLLKERIRYPAELIRAIETVADGGSVIDPLIVDALINARAKTPDSRLSQLTAREHQILGEIASGKSNGAIAQSLFLTKRAVEKHVNAIFVKLSLPETEDVSRRVKATLIFLAEEETPA